MRTQIDLGQRLFGGSARTESRQSPVRHGTAVGASSGGYVSVLFDGSAEPVSIACDGSFAAGQRVSVACADGVYKVISEATVEEIPVSFIEAL